MEKEFNSTKNLEKVSKTTCYMCACRCGIDVHLKDNEVVHIEGNRDHPVNKGVLCAKGASGIFQHKAASRLKKPLRRVGERGEGRPAGTADGTGSAAVSCGCAEGRGNRAKTIAGRGTSGRYCRRRPDAATGARPDL